jgi:hypothetical protein
MKAFIFRSAVYTCLVNNSVLNFDIEVLKQYQFQENIGSFNNGPLMYLSIMPFIFIQGVKCTFSLFVCYVQRRCLVYSVPFLDVYSLKTCKRGMLLNQA